MSGPTVLVLTCVGVCVFGIWLVWIQERTKARKSKDADQSS